MPDKNATGWYRYNGSVHARRATAGNHVPGKFHCQWCDTWMSDAERSGKSRHCKKCHQTNIHRK